MSQQSYRKCVLEGIRDKYLGCSRGDRVLTAVFYSVMRILISAMLENSHIHHKQKMNANSYFLFTAVKLNQMYSLCFPATIVFSLVFQKKKEKSRGCDLYCVMP